MGHYFRERGREMYFTLALLLLVAPAFGRPSSPVLNAGVEVVNELDSYVEFSLGAGKTLNNSKLFEKVSEAIKEADQTVIDMELHLISLKEKVPELRTEENYFPAFNEAKRYLRETRQELRNLATKTVIEVRDLKDLLEGVDKGEDEDNILLKTSIDKMKNFMIETLERLDNAREKYQSAIEIFDNLNSSIETQTEVLNKVLKADTADFRKDEKYNEKIEVLSLGKHFYIWTLWNHQLSRQHHPAWRSRRSPRTTDNALKEYVGEGQKTDGRYRRGNRYSNR